MAATYPHLTHSLARRMRNALACRSGVGGNTSAGATNALAGSCMR
jgi:hypothetical protein